MLQTITTNLRQWISRNKALLFSLACLSTFFFVRFCVPPVVANPPVQKEEKKVEVKKEKQKTKGTHSVVAIRGNKTTTTITKEYDKNSGKLIKETKTETKQDKEVKKDTTAKVEQAEKVEQKTEIKKEYAQPYTGITAGALVLPSGSGVTVGATIAELPPLTVSAQLGYIVSPQPAPAIGVSLNGAVAPRLEAGVGVYVGPQTSMGYDPVPGVPVSVQPGVLIQYRF